MKKTIIYIVGALLSASCFSQNLPNCKSNPQETVNTFANEYNKKIKEEINNLSKMKFDTTQYQVKTYSNLIKAKEIVEKNKKDDLVSWCEKSMKELKVLEMTEPNYSKNLITYSTEYQKTINNTACYGKLSCDEYVVNQYEKNELGDTFSTKTNYSFTNIYSYLNYVSKNNSNNTQENLTANKDKIEECKSDLKTNIDILNAIVLTTQDSINILNKKSAQINESSFYEDLNLLKNKINISGTMMKIIEGIDPDNLDSKNIELCLKASQPSKIFLVYNKDREELKRDELFYIGGMNNCIDRAYCSKTNIENGKKKASEKRSKDRFNELYQKYIESKESLNLLNNSIPKIGKP